MKNYFRIKSVFYLIYIILVILWIGLEFFSIDQVSVFGVNIPVRSNWFEILLGISSIVVFLKLYFELSEARTLVQEAEANLKKHTKKLSFPRGTELGEEFWKSVKLQFTHWELTTSEQELAKFLLRGFSNQQIAAIRDKSLRTIENQALSIYRKTGMTGKLEFIAYFIEPLLPEEED